MRSHISGCVAMVLIIAGTLRAQSASAPALPPAPTESNVSNSINQSPATAQNAALPPATRPSGGTESPTTQQIGKVVVTSDLDVARQQIMPSLGASSYTITPEQIKTIPGGENTPFQQVLLRAPGVVQDSFGQEHVRGEHANLTYSVNGVLLPQPISEFGQELDTRLIDSVSLITGSLPAQYGFHTAGVVDVQTKSGDSIDHNELSLYGGSFDTFNSSVQLGGSQGDFDYFVTGSYFHSGLGIENPTDSYKAIHDDTDQYRAFGYFSLRLDPTSRVSLLVNSSYADFQIPNTPGLPTNFALAGVPTFDSAHLNETQNEQEYYTVVSYQKTLDNASWQLSGFTRYGQITFNPDQTGDLLFNGVSSAIYNPFLTNGMQFDSSYIVNSDHTVRAGFIADYTTEQQNATVGVFPVDATGAQTSDVPFYISDHSSNYGTEAGLYIQDEWRLTKQLTLNYGARYDCFNSNFDDESQLSPRANLVWKATKKTTFHGGYARYFVPPPVQNTDIQTVNKFIGTTNQSEILLADPSKAERSNYYDIGVSHQLTDQWNVGLDGFYKQVKNLLDLGQFGQALILSPFNYAVGKVYGAELSTAYKRGGFSTFGNLSWVETAAHDINSQQFLIDADEFAYIQNHDIHLDHDSQFAGSGGVSYQWERDLVYVDILYGSGLRTGFANTGQVGPHYPVNLGWQHIFHPDGQSKTAWRLRADIVNLFDQKYAIRDGEGVGVGAPQFGERLGFFVGLTFQF